MSTKEAVAEGFAWARWKWDQGEIGYGSSTPREAWLAALGCKTPELRMTARECDELRLVQLNRLQGLFDLMLTELKAKCHEKGGHVHILMPEAQRRYCEQKRSGAIGKQSARLVKELTHINVSGLTDAELKERDDALQRARLRDDLVRRFDRNKKLLD